MSHRHKMTTIVLFAGISLGACTPLLKAASITVTSPNGTTTWSAGTTHNINWSSTGVVGDVFIDLYQGGIFKEALAYVPVSDQTYAWSICEYIGDSTNYSIVITGFTTLFVPVYGLSGDFSINDSLTPPPTPTISLTSPDGGQNWPAGTVQTITWTSTDPAGDVLVELDKDGAFHSYLGSVAMADGYFDWDICPHFGDGTTYTIRLLASDVCGHSIEDASNAPFSISGSLPPLPTPTLTLTSPNGGENWSAGSSHTVTWSTTDPLGDVTISLQQAGGYVSTLATVPMVAGSFVWDICPSIGDGTDYTLVITGADACGESVEDSSNAPFTISSSVAAPSLIVTSPSDGDIWSAYSEQTITWDATNPNGTCYVYLLSYSGETFQDVQLLGSTAMSSGQLAWSVDQCKGRITDGSYEVFMVYDCLENPQQAVSGIFGMTPVGIVGDLNDDCGVDSGDIDILSACASGSEIVHDGTLQCQTADVDSDQDVDADDFAVLQRCLSNVDNPAAPSCIY